MNNSGLMRKTKSWLIKEERKKPSRQLLIGVKLEEGWKRKSLAKKRILTQLQTLRKPEAGLVQILKPKTSTPILRTLMNFLNFQVLTMRQNLKTLHLYVIERQVQLRNVTATWARPKASRGHL